MSTDFFSKKVRIALSVAILLLLLIGEGIGLSYYLIQRNPKEWGDYVYEDSSGGNRRSIRGKRSMRWPICTRPLAICAINTSAHWALEFYSDKRTVVIPCVSSLDNFRVCFFL